MEEDNKQESAKVEASENQQNYIKITKFQLIMLIFVLIFASAGITLAALSFGEEKAVNIGVEERREFNKLYKAYDELTGKYFEQVDEHALIEGAIDGMVQALDDPYSDYMTKEENEHFKESISSSFEGIGAEIQQMDGNIVVVSPIKGTPAEEAGIQPNDIIMAVDDESIQGMSANEAVLLIRGEKGTKVTLTILRGEQSLDVTITRAEIPINTVYAEMLEDGIAKIQITSFSTHTDQDLLEALEEMEKQGMKSLILDVRRNPGGLLNQAEIISNLFVPEGEKLYQIEFRDGTTTAVTAKGGTKIEIPTVVLIDGGSASASEILAGAMRESADIPLVGEKSFGKGTVQTAEDFTDGSNIKYTMAKWLTPEGNWIHETGIIPDFQVPLPDYASLPYINPESTFTKDSSAEEVRAAKEMLRVIGYDIGEITPHFDDNMVEVTKSFQADEGLEVTGELSGDTTIALMTNLREHLLENDPQVFKAIELLTE